MWSFSHTPLVPCPCAAWKPQALSSRGWAWAWAALSGHPGRGLGSCREKPGGRVSGAQSRAAQSPAQGWRTDRAHSALCWQRSVLAPSVGRLPAGERVHVPGPDRSSLLLQSALRNPLPSLRNPIPSQALQTHPRLQIPGTAFHPPAPVSHSPPSVCQASSPHFSSPLWRNGGLCGPASEASLTPWLAFRVVETAQGRIPRPPKGRVSRQKDVQAVPSDATVHLSWGAQNLGMSPRAPAGVTAHTTRAYIRRAKAGAQSCPQLPRCGAGPRQLAALSGLEVGLLRPRTWGPGSSSSPLTVH